MEENKNKHSAFYPNKIWVYRKRKGLGQKQLAYLMGIDSVAEISRYERGVKSPSLKNAIKLEIILSTPVAFIFPDLRHELWEEITKRREQLRHLPKSHDDL